jgi:hypothetical protein
MNKLFVSLVCILAGFGVATAPTNEWLSTHVVDTIWRLGSENLPQPGWSVSLPFDHVKHFPASIVAPCSKILFDIIASSVSFSWFFIASLQQGVRPALAVQLAANDPVVQIVNHSS